MIGEKVKIKVEKEVNFFCITGLKRGEEAGRLSCLLSCHPKLVVLPFPGRIPFYPSNLRGGPAKTSTKVLCPLPILPLLLNELRSHDPFGLEVSSDKCQLGW